MPQSTTRRKSTAKNRPPSQTKFDAWLENHLEEGAQVAFLFQHDPVDPEKAGKSSYLCNILTVDRYMLYVEISFGEDHLPVWVAKDNILSAS